MQTKATRQTDRQSGVRYSRERLKEKFERNSKREGLSKRIGVSSERLLL